MIAALAVETQIPHQCYLDLLEHHPDLFDTTLAYLDYREFVRKLHAG